MSKSETRWFEWLRWGMLIAGMAWTTSGVAQETANRTQPPSPESLHEPAQFATLRFPSEPAN